MRKIDLASPEPGEPLIPTERSVLAGVPEKTFSLNLEGKVAIVTGASRGLGKHIAQTLGKSGARVVVVGRNGDKLDETAHAIIKAGGKALPLVCDVSDANAVAETFHEIAATFGAVDLLVNNAGETGPIDHAWQVDIADWWKTFETNLLGAFLCTHAVLPHMVERRRGIVVNIASHAGVFRWPTCSAYAVSKSALIKLTENLAAETIRHGVSIFALHPGLLPIGLTELEDPSAVDPASPKGKVVTWFQEQLATGKVVNVQQSLDMIAKLVSGRYRPLSGCYIAPDDDLDVMKERLRGMGRHSDLYRLRLST
ncbi:SDR family NAD(P)-dependent oxidoreductase [Rhizobium sp. BT-226]|uniref:SDR family NAD(P)-dependent oxidoreductase n=1 Tax=Rhizobium sp. BT-226 TaxID=2986922 RepID=UPI0021F6A99A|nr:SDR family oxidoreductase [Rhizobium sp. BT-226]MCW0021423.1 SDR family oxidoreductase [Rhizobium sp. BT-226]